MTLQYSLMDYEHWLEEVKAASANMSMADWQACSVVKKW
jgi:hypothetical protein